MCIRDSVWGESMSSAPIHPFTIPTGSESPRRVAAKPANLDPGEIIYVTATADKGLWTADDDRVPYAVQLRRKPLPFLTYSTTRAYQDLQLPANYTDYTRVSLTMWYGRSNSRLQLQTFDTAMLQQGDISNINFTNFHLSLIHI